MAPYQGTDDYYRVLGIAQSAGKDDVRASYKRLAKTHHPDRNPTDPQATARFQMIEAAYSTLVDSDRRRVYDLHYSWGRPRGSMAAECTKSHYSAQADSQDFESAQIHKQQIEELDATLRKLRYRKDALESDLCDDIQQLEHRREVIGRFKEQEERMEEENAQIEAYNNSWAGFFFPRRPPEKEKQERLNYIAFSRAYRTDREAEAERCIVDIATKKGEIGTLEAEITKKQIERNTVQQQEWRRQEAARAGNQQRKAQQKERERKAREDSEMRRWKQNSERLRRKQEAERLRREQARDAEEEVLRKIREELGRIREVIRPGSQIETNGENMHSGMRSKEEDTNRSLPTEETKTVSCLQNPWWAREVGYHKCGRCFSVTCRCAFRCPGCRMIACAGCHRILRG